MTIKTCLRCEKSWCYRGAGTPLRCGKCGTPYWNIPPKDKGHDPETCKVYKCGQCAVKKEK